MIEPAENFSLSSTELLLKYSSPYHQKLHFRLELAILLAFATQSNADLTFIFDAQSLLSAGELALSN
jgi:hypothetical protein